MLVSNHVGVERHRRLHRGQADQLEDVIRDHVPQRSSALVVVAPSLHADRLGDRNLHVVDVVAVPDRLEDAVGKAKGQDVLNGLLPEVVIDAIDLPLLQNLPDVGVQRSRRLEIASKGLLDDDAPPSAVVLGRQSDVAHTMDTRCEELRRGGQVVEIVAPGAVLAVDLPKQRLQVLKCRFVREVAVDVVQAPREPVPHIGIDRVGAELPDFLAAPVAELLVAHLGAGEPDERKLTRKQIVLGQVVERRNQLAFREIP